MHLQILIGSLWETYFPYGPAKTERLGEEDESHIIVGHALSVVGVAAYLPFGERVDFHVFVVTLQPKVCVPHPDGQSGKIMFFDISALDQEIYPSLIQRQL